MSEESLTIRLDSDLKAQIKQAADQANYSITDFVLRAVRAKLAPQCPTCGRSDLPLAAPVGFTPAFEQFYTEATRGRKELSGPVMLTTLEGRVPKVYSVRMRSDSPLEGTLMVYALVGRGLEDVSIPVPRGVITGWRHDSIDDDGIGHWYRLNTALGYADGNAPARHLAQMIAAQRRRR